jgi:hypothetical protein
MPLEANILLKEHPMLMFISMTIGDGQHDVLLDHPFRRKGGGPRLRGVDSSLLTAAGGVAGYSPQRG